jgi:hypothetical protein
MSNMFLNIVSTFKGNGISTANKQLGEFGRATSGLGSTLGKVGAAIASFGLAAKAVKFTKESIDSARDLERNIFSVKTIFDEFSPAIEKFTLNAENLGLAQKDAAKASTFLGSVLKQSGFSMEFVTAETQKLVSLGVDLAATYGYDVQEALLGMTALFRGEYDPIEKFGVAMKQSEINAELAARGQDKLEGAARRNAEQTIRLELLYQRAADATGAFTAQSGNLYVEQKKLQAQFENLQATVGTQLLPVMGELVAALKPLVDELTPRLTQAVTDSLPALEVFIQFIKDTGDATTTTGQTMGFLADSVGATFKFISSNFGVLVQFALLLGTVTTALRLFAIASAFVVANPITAALLLAGGAFIFGADAARRLTDDTNLAGASLKAFNGIGNETAKTGVYMGGKFGRLAVDFADTSDEAKRLQTEVANADRARLENLKAQVNGVRISAAYAANELRRMSMMAGVKPSQSGAAADVSTTVTTGGKPAAAALSAVEQLNKTQTLSVKQAEAQGKLLGVGLEQGVVNQILAMSKPVKSANDIFKSLTKKNGELSKKGIAKVKEYNDTFNAGIEQVNQRAAEAASAAAAAAQEAQRQADELRRAEEARIEGLNQLYANFLETIKGTFAGIRTAIQGAFDITGLGGSTNAIIRNMNKLLAKMKSFSANVKSLATMGLDPALLQQVIQAGPVAGSRLAAALVAGGAGALGDINAGFMQASSLASEIATTGVNSLFDTKAQQNQYNITVTGGVGSGATIGKAIVDAIKDYERTSGAVWQGA